MQVIFPSDNILSKLCDEQKFFKKYIPNFSNVIPYCKLSVDVEKIRPNTIFIKEPTLKNNLVIKECIYEESLKEIFIGNFILGSFPKEKKDFVLNLIRQKDFKLISFKTFYLCDFKISNTNFFSWEIKNVKWYKAKS